MSDNPVKQFDPEAYKRIIEREFSIVDKDKNDVPFLLNKAQDHFIHGLTERNVVLKARKLGFSSVKLGIAVAKFLFGKNEKCVCMSFDKDAATKQLARAKYFLTSYAIKQARELGTDYHTVLNQIMKYNTKTGLEMRGVDKNGMPYTNVLNIGTARSDSFGRGDDITFLHITEVAFCDDLPALLAGVTQALVNGAMATFETTANGFGQFKTFWDESEMGETGFKTFFYGPEWEYDEEFLIQKEKELKGLFRQEYPRNPQEAFITSGESYFDKESLAWYLENCGNEL